jgi:hypothetical protein
VTVLQRNDMLSTVAACCATWPGNFCICVLLYSLGPKRVMFAYLCASWQPKAAEQTEQMDSPH